MNDGYTKIKNILITSSKLDDTEFRILTYLISISKNGFCYPSVFTIASNVNISESTAKRKLTSLQKKGFVLKENRTLGTGKKTSNVYLINEDALSKNKKKPVCIVEEQQPEADEEKEQLREQIKQMISDYDWVNEE